MRPRQALVLGNGAAGAENQAIALAKATGLPHRLVRSVPSPAAMRLPLRAQLAVQSVLGCDSLGLRGAEPPFPALAVSCGRGSVPASVDLRARSGRRTLTVHVQRPLCDESAFDLVVAPRHDYLGDSAPANVLLTEGALHAFDAAALDAARATWANELEPFPRPRLALLFGGPTTRRWWQRQAAPTPTPASATALVRSAEAATAAAGGSLLATVSRRTPVDVRDALGAAVEAARARGLPAWLWGGEGANPYAGFLACADHLLVTADSVSMVSEACATGAPVYIAAPDECRGRIAAFHRRLTELGRTMPWEGALLDDAPRVPLLDDMARSTARVVQLLRERDERGWRDDHERRSEI